MTIQNFLGIVNRVHKTKLIQSAFSSQKIKRSVPKADGAIAKTKHFYFIRSVVLLYIAVPDKILDMTAFPAIDFLAKKSNSKFIPEVNFKM